MKCKCCVKNKKEDDFHKIKLSIGDVLIREKIVEEICSDCLDINDVCFLYHNKKGEVSYDIKNKSRYNKKALSFFTESLSCDYYFGLEECREALAKLGKSVSYEYMKNHNKKYRKLGFYSKKIFGGESIFTGGGRDIWGISKKEFDKFWSLNVRGYFRKTNKSKFNFGEDCLNSLMEEGYIYKCDGDSYYVFVDTKENRRLCRCCGGVKHNDNYFKNSTSFCKECLSERRKKRYKNMTEEERGVIRQRTREFKKTDKYKNYKKSPIVRFSNNVRNKLKVSFDSGGWSKKTNTYKYIGLTFNEFIEYIGNQFTEGMTWDNWSVDGWHLDHRLPLTAGKNDKEKTIMLWHHTNLQPMWAEENIAKGGKYCPKELEAFLAERRAADE